MMHEIGDQLRWIAKFRGDSLDFWFTPTAWCTDRTAPVACQATPKDRIATSIEAEPFVTPPFSDGAAKEIVQATYGLGWMEMRAPSGENPEGFITAITK
jgi:hypothetical protein